jgi:hypothetical protein
MWNPESVWTLWRRGNKSCTVGNGTRAIQPVAVAIPTSGKWGGVRISLKNLNRPLSHFRSAGIQGSRFSSSRNYVTSTLFCRCRKVAARVHAMSRKNQKHATLIVHSTFMTLQVSSLRAPDLYTLEQNADHNFTSTDVTPSTHCSCQRLRIGSWQLRKARSAVHELQRYLMLLHLLYTLGS